MYKVIYEITLSYREIERQREREKERQTDSQTQTQRQRQRQRVRELTKKRHWTECKLFHFL